MYYNYQQPPRENMYTFHVAGIAFHDKELKAVIKSLLENNKLKKYCGFTNKDLIDNNMDLSIYGNQYLKGVQFEQYNYKGSLALKVLIADATGKLYDIGNVPRKEIPYVQTFLNNMHTISKVEYEIVGGKTKNVKYDMDEDKDYIETVDLNYGVVIYIYYYLYQ